LGTAGQNGRVKSSQTPGIRIGAWSVDPALDEISRDGNAVKLEPKLMQLLLALAAHAGQVVSVEQLLDEVWKDVIVTPDSVYHAVAALRRALGDDSKDPTYIANVMRRGYRLIAPVAPIAAVAELPSTPKTVPAAERRVSWSATDEPRAALRASSGRRPALVGAAALAAVLGGLLVYGLWTWSRARPVTAKEITAQQAVPQASVAAAPAFEPPPHSVAVLPFVNLSGDKDQEFFSDGLTEELINSLARINELQVAARASAFAFKGKDADVGTIAHKLNVGAILEGSVRRSGRTIRVTAQLDNAVTGFHLWSQTYDRDLGDVLKIQSEIATAVAEALRVSLLANVSQKVEIGETRNAAAFDAYLRGRKVFASRHGQADLDAAVREYTKAIRLDDHYALAFVGRSEALQESMSFEGITADKAHTADADARQAVMLAPALGLAHAVLAGVHGVNLQFARMGDEMDRAFELSPGSVDVLQGYATYSALVGRFDRAVVTAHRAVLLDPLNRDSHATLGLVLLFARRYQESNQAFQEARTVDPDFFDQMNWEPSYLLGELQDAREQCEKKAATWVTELCLAVVYHKLGRNNDAELQLAQLRAASLKGDDWYQYAQICAQWGRVPQALDFLERAVRDPLNVGLIILKVDPLLDPLRQEPRFQAIETALKFPQ
jgi:TolB-like protein/DNA-binding winged helix-turn-helix (wHTH) protein